MSEISFYFKPVESSSVPLSRANSIKRFGEMITSYKREGQFPDLSGIDIAIFGVDEDRGAYDNSGCSQASSFVREPLYQLFPVSPDMKVADLGDIIRGHDLQDTYFAVTAIVCELLKQKIIPVIIGGGQDITYAAYKAYENLEQIINIVAVDKMFDLGESHKELNSQSYLSHIILHRPNFLFNFTNIAYQTYFVDQSSVSLMKKLFFDIYRLGVVQKSIQETEPLVRNADLLTFDMGAIRGSDAPANGNITPNGLYGEEACQITRYAGMSDKLSCIGFYEMNPSYDRRSQTAQLLAEMVWYFIDGFYNRQKDVPSGESDDFIRYTVQIDNDENGIIFYKSKLTDRWWMEVKCADNIKEKYMQHYLIPCSYNDYQTALKNEIPDRWWQALQKLM
jgi:formiminoglutamase